MDGRWCQHFPRSGGRKRRPSHTSTNTPDSVLHIGYFVSFRTVVQTEPLKHAVKNRRLYKQYLGMKVSALINPQNVLAAGWDENWNESRCYSAHCLGERPFNLLHTHTLFVWFLYFISYKLSTGGVASVLIRYKGNGRRLGPSITVKGCGFGACQSNWRSFEGAFVHDGHYEWGTASASQARWGRCGLCVVLLKKAWPL